MFVIILGSTQRDVTRITMINVINDFLNRLICPGALYQPSSCVLGREIGFVAVILMVFTFSLSEVTPFLSLSKLYEDIAMHSVGVWVWFESLVELGNGKTVFCFSYSGEQK